VQAGDTLEGALTLDMVVEGLPAPGGGGRAFVYIEVRPPPATPSAAAGRTSAAGALSGAGEWEAVSWAWSHCVWRARLDPRLDPSTNRASASLDHPVLPLP
jgi:hypothetical protein